MHTFIDCNLANVEIDPSWEIINCLSIHTYMEIEQEGEKSYEVQYLEKDGRWVVSQRTDVSSIAE